MKGISYPDTFSQGRLSGTGRDRVGEFQLTGEYNIQDGLWLFAKQYLGQHTVSYRGYNEGKGIWGTWELSEPGIRCTGGFHIWPENFGMTDPSTLKEALAVPQEELSPVLASSNA